VIDDDPAVRDLMQRLLARTAIGWWRRTGRGGSDGARLWPDVIAGRADAGDGRREVWPNCAAIRLKEIPVVMATIMDEHQLLRWAPLST
jgi:hypothetical protein